MKFLLIFLPLMLVIWPATGQSLEQTFYGKVGEVMSILVIEQNMDTITGRIDAGGYRYDLSGNVSGNRMEGKLIDPQTGGVLDFTGDIGEEMINLTLADKQSSRSIPLNFTSNREAVAAGSSSVPSSVDKSNDRDPALVGNWLYSESYTSGDYGFASQWRLIVQADGTYLYGDAKLAGGGPGTSASSEGGGYTRGQWKTENMTIFINEGYGWQPYAGYYIEGNSMLMKFSDGSRQVWKRY